MNVYEVPVMAANAVAANAARPATALLHDAPSIRLVLFRLDAGQEVTPHTSDSAVLLIVSEGSGFVSNDSGERAVRVGEVITYEPRERHGMRAGRERLVLLAVITPRPGAP